jgi:glycosyltransferase involved in cell wall biosynthesis
MVVPKVSIVIPVFNSGPLLRDTLAGIQQQTFQDFEIIVVDDGSTDNIQKLVTSADSSIRFYRQTNQGPAVARNRGVSLAQGEFVAFCDHDDIWNDQHLETLLAVFFANPSTAMAFDKAIHCDLKDANVAPRRTPDQEKELVSGPVSIRQIWQCCVASMSVVMVRKAIFDKLGGLHPKIWGLDDLHFYLKCLEDLRAHHPEVVRAIGRLRYRLRLARKYRKLARRCSTQNRQLTAYQYYWQAYRLNVLNVSILKQLWLAGRTGVAAPR